MPYIEAKVSCKLSEEQIEALKNDFGKAIECIPGKSENWLMVNIEDEKRLYFKGNADDETAYIYVSILGHAEPDAYAALTNEITIIVSEITGISGSRIYVSYREADTWGWNGSNF